MVSSCNQVDIENGPSGQKNNMFHTLSTEGMATLEYKFLSEIENVIVGEPCPLLNSIR